jgi:hypothetical protein
MFLSFLIRIIKRFFGIIAIIVPTAILLFERFEGWEKYVLVFLMFLGLSIYGSGKKGGE